MNNPMNITSIDMLRTYNSGSVVELPAFAEGQPFIARLRRPSMLTLMKNGKIPNSLLSTATELFYGDKDEERTNDDMTAMLEVIEVLADASFVEPSWNELKGAEIELTDEQYIFIFQYSQQGVTALNNFREDGENNGSVAPVGTVPDKTVNSYGA